MNRKYTIEEFIKLCQYIRKQMPNVAITTDYIVAFGNETDKQFNNAITNLKKIKFANMNIFIYSRRHGTAADKLYKKDINPLIARQRYNKVVEIKDMYQKQYLESFIGKTLDVIVERSKVPTMHGYSSEFIKVVFKSNKNLHTKLVKVRINKVSKDNAGYYLNGQKI
ncbi:MAG: hypothetical protein MJ233_02440 [Mycoplasmoidaceae bacterium]|nr:hypothetical protein [Mycoplasmoidaceae bacterium]